MKGRKEVRKMPRKILRNKEKRSAVKFFRDCFRMYSRIRLRLPGSVYETDRITLLCNTCLGGVILSDLHMRFNSPFINLWMYPKDFLKVCGDLTSYMEQPLVFIEDRREYPVALLGDVKIYFRHYHSRDEAAEAWERRKKRMSPDHLFILFSERNGCTYEDLKAFDALPYARKAVITTKEYPEIQPAVYIEEFEDEKASGIGTRYRKGGCRRYIDDFDYVEWFRSGKIRRR